MIISWITKDGKSSMGKLEDTLEEKLVQFCIAQGVKPLNELELKQYIPIQFVEPKQEQKPQVNNAQVPQVKKSWWKR